MAEKFGTGLTPSGLHHWAALAAVWAFAVWAALATIWAELKHHWAALAAVWAFAVWAALAAVWAEKFETPLGRTCSRLGLRRLGRTCSRLGGKI